MTTPKMTQAEMDDDPNENGDDAYQFDLPPPLDKMTQEEWDALEPIDIGPPPPSPYVRQPPR